MEMQCNAVEIKMSDFDETNEWPKVNIFNQASEVTVIEFRPFLWVVVTCHRHSPDQLSALKLVCTRSVAFLNTLSSVFNPQMVLDTHPNQNGLLRVQRKWKWEKAQAKSPLKLQRGRRWNWVLKL